MKLRISAQSVNSVLQSIWKNSSTTCTLPSRNKSTSCCTTTNPSDPKIIVPANCRQIPPPIATPRCRVVVVIGGADNGFGYAAAEQLLHHGARRVVLADSDAKAGVFAAQRLCKAYGRDRAVFYPCDVKNSCQVEGIFKSSPCKDEHVSILFNDIDAIQSLPESRMNYCGDAVKISNTQRITRLALELMRPVCQTKSPPSLIVNCAAILGFMGWPVAPEPVYCLPNEPTIQTTRDMAEKFPAESSGIRLVALCPSNCEQDDIGLPDFPEVDTRCPPRSCTPDPTKDRVRVGQALLHLLARAETGSAWLLGPPYTLRQTPKLVRFPRDGDGQTTEKRDEECSVSFYFLKKLTSSQQSNNNAECPRHCKTKNTCFN